jgi:hypothetical protein
MTKKADMSKKARVRGVGSSCHGPNCDRPWP